MVRLFYSNRTEELLAELGTRVRAQQLRDGPLVPVTIVVPSAGFEDDVRLAIAERCGIAANLDIVRLTRFASDEVARSEAGRGSGAVDVAEATSIQAMVLALLLDDDVLATRELAPVRAYLRGAGEAADSVDVRRVQLSSRIGRIFEEYSYSREELLAGWRRGLVLGMDDPETEVWQRHLWMALFGPDGLARRRAAGGAPLCVPLCEAVGRFDAGPAPRAVHVLAFSHFARAFHALLQRLALSAEVTVYALSPCEGFWEDVDPSDPEPLLLWARPGREQVRFLNAIAAFDHDERFIDPAGQGASPTLLRRFQSDLLQRRSPSSAGAVLDRAASAMSDRAGATLDRGARADESVQILEHASVHRELEAVGSEIWRLCEDDAGLRFDQIAVLVPDADAEVYAAHLPAVFREAYEIPHRLVAMRAPMDPVLEAIDLLLSLALGRFTRQELLRLAVHPLLVASLNDVDPRRWTRWCDELGIVHGADRSDHDGTYIGGDTLNWDQGLRRLALGSFMAGEASGDAPPFELGGERYVVHEVSPSEMRDAAAFGILTRSLLADARFARSAELTLTQWAAFLRALATTYVTPTTRDQEERFATCLRRLHEIGRVDVGGRRIRYRLASELARDRLRSVTGGFGGEGVVVSTVNSFRSLPSRVVFACGMGEGHFPSPGSEDPLDLRWANRREGDVSARERDRYRFLELLLGTRDRLYLSYVSRDPVTGDALAPSVVVEELVHALERAYGIGRDALCRRHPLRRFAPEYFPELFPAALSMGPGRPRGGLGTMRLPEARAEARTLALRTSALASGSRLDPLAVTERASNDADWGALADHLRLAPLPRIAPAEEGRVSVPLYAIVKFLELPVQGWARFRLGLDEHEEDDAMSREDEPFETAVREETLLLRRILLEAALAGRSPEVAYDAEVERRALCGTGPSGVFARGERRSHLQTLNGWGLALAQEGVPLETLAVHRFGRAGEHARAHEVHDALSIDLEVVDRAGVRRLVRVEIGGRTLPLGLDATASFLLTRRPGADPKEDDWAAAERDRLALRAFVDHAILSAAGVRAGRAHTSLVLSARAEGSAVERVSFAPLSRDAAGVWLRHVIGDLLGGPHAYFLPCEAVFVRARRGSKGLLVPVVLEAADRMGDDDDRAALRSSYGPVPWPHRYPPPDETSARAMAARRFDAILGGRTEVR